MDIKARSTDKETTNSSDWANDDLSKVKWPERRGSFSCTGKFLVRKERRLHDPQVPLLKAQVKFLHEGFMMFAAAVQEQVPNLNLSSVMNYMNMEVISHSILVSWLLYVYKHFITCYTLFTLLQVDDLSSIPDNTIGKNPSSASASGTASASCIASGTTSGTASASGTASGTTHHQNS